MNGIVSFSGKTIGARWFAGEWGHCVLIERHNHVASAVQ